MINLAQVLLPDSREFQLSDNFEALIMKTILCNPSMLKAVCLLLIIVSNTITNYEPHYFIVWILDSVAASLEWADAGDETQEKRTQN